MRLLLCLHLTCSACGVYAMARTLDHAAAVFELFESFRCYRTMSIYRCTLALAPMLPLCPQVILASGRM